MGRASVARACTCINYISRSTSRLALVDQFGSFAKCISMLSSIVPSLRLIAGRYLLLLFVCSFMCHYTLKVGRFTTAKFHSLVRFEGSHTQNGFMAHIGAGKLWKVFTLGARITFDKHRNEFLQTHRRTFICLGHTLDFTPTSHSARLRIGIHLYWRWLLYYLFVYGCRIRCGALIFSNSEIMRKAWSWGRSGDRARCDSGSNQASPCVR